MSGQELKSMYSMAALYVYPSWYEGFGLPILEAQACGCPVLISNLTSCPEAAGEGAHFVDPYSVEAIKEGILRMLTDQDYKNTLIKKGYENIKRFSWEKSAEVIISSIRENILSDI